MIGFKKRQARHPGGPIAAAAVTQLLFELRAHHWDEARRARHCIFVTPRQYADIFDYVNDPVTFVPPTPPLRWKGFELVPHAFTGEAPRMEQR